MSTDTTLVGMANTMTRNDFPILLLIATRAAKVLFFRASQGDPDSWVGLDFRK